MTDLSNPYTSTTGYDSKHKISARVSPEDVAYLERLLPLHTGLQDKILSTLYFKFINELRRRGLDPTNPAHVAIIRHGHSTESIVSDVLSAAFVERCPVGESTGSARPRNGTRGTRGVHKTVRGSAKQRTNTKGDTEKGE